jgi:hypothetical protein
MLPIEPRRTVGRQAAGRLEFMPRKRVDDRPTTPIVNFNFEDRTYQIDPGRKKVYRRFVEIETSKAFEILSTWRAQHVSV